MGRTIVIRITVHLNMEINTGKKRAENVNDEIKSEIEATEYVFRSSVDKTGAKHKRHLNESHQKDSNENIENCGTNYCQSN